MLTVVPKARIALYSAITGHYERPSEILPASIVEALPAGVDLFRFTDSVDSSSEPPDTVGSGWREVHVTPRVPFDPIRSARAIKILGNPALAQYDVTIWVDNRIHLKVSPEELVERFLPSDCDMAVPLHSFHASLAAEFDAILDGWVDDPRRVREQRSVYRRAVPALLAQRVSWTAILIRRNNAAIRTFNALWWEQVLRYSRRDQLSFPYACEMSPGLGVAHFTADNFGTDFHQWRPSSEVGRRQRARLWNPHDLSRADLTAELRDTPRLLIATLGRGLGTRRRPR